MDLIKKEAKNAMNKNRKFLTYQQAKNFNTNYDFKTIQDYRQYVIDNNLNFLPKEPSVTYGRYGYKAWDFLGLDEVVYKTNLRELLSKNCAMMRSRITAESHIKRTATLRGKHKPVETQAVSIVEKSSKGLDPDAVIKFLITEDVEPATITKLVAEMDIHSSTLMNDLCKYMQERSKRQQSTWRPTGYQTAEAEFAKVG